MTLNPARQPAPSIGSAADQQGRPFDFLPALKELVSKGQVKVPPYPAVALKLSELVRRQNYGLKEVVSLVSADPALAVEVIRCSNSAFYGRGEINSLLPAIQRVGAQEVVRLAVVSGLAASNRAPGPLTKLRRKAWHDAVAGALVAQLLARQRSLPPDNGFLCGLLHDFGALLCIGAIEELLRLHPHETPKDVSAWSDALDACHVDFGVQLAERWKLPGLLHDVIAQHHASEPSTSPHAAMIEVVQLTDRVVRLVWSRPHVSAEELAALPGMRPAEAQRLAAALPDIPSVIESFEQEIKSRPVLPKVRLSPPTTGEEGLWHPLRLPVELHSPKRPCRFEVRSVSEVAWAMHGKDPLPDGLLLDVGLGEPGDALRLWARSSRCALDEGGFLVECRPLLLSAAAHVRWRAMLQAAIAAQAAAPVAAPAAEPGGTDGTASVSG